MELAHRKSCSHAWCEWSSQQASVLVPPLSAFFMGQELYTVLKHRFFTIIQV